MVKKFRVSLYNGNVNFLIINDVIEIIFLPFAVHISSDFFSSDFDYDDFNRIEVTFYD